MGTGALHIFTEVTPPWNAILTAGCIAQVCHLVVVVIDLVDFLHFNENIDDWFGKDLRDGGAADVVNKESFVQYRLIVSSYCRRSNLLCFSMMYPLLD